MKKIILPAAGLFLIAAFVCAQSGGFQKPGAAESKAINEGARIQVESLPVMIPRVTVQQGRKPVNLRDLDVEIEIVGNVALTTYDMTFHNPNSAVLEGEFVICYAARREPERIRHRA